MNVRKKNAKEREYDQAELNKAKYALAEEAISFAQEFVECEGDVWYSSYKKFSNKAWEYEREKENSVVILWWCVCVALRAQAAAMRGRLLV